MSKGFRLLLNDDLGHLLPGAGELHAHIHELNLAVALGRRIQREDLESRLINCDLDEDRCVAFHDDGHGWHSGVTRTLRHLLANVNRHLWLSGELKIPDLLAINFAGANEFASHFGAFLKHPIHRRDVRFPGIADGYRLGRKCDETEDVSQAGTSHHLHHRGARRLKLGARRFEERINGLRALDFLGHLATVLIHHFSERALGLDLNIVENKAEQSATVFLHITVGVGRVHAGIEAHFLNVLADR